MPWKFRRGRWTRFRGAIADSIIILYPLYLLRLSRLPIRIVDDNRTSATVIVIGSKLLLITAPVYKNASLGITRNRHNEYRAGPGQETNDPAYGGREREVTLSPDRFASLTRNDRSPAEPDGRPRDSAGGDGKPRGPSRPEAFGAHRAWSRVEVEMQTIDYQLHTTFYTRHLP